MTDDRKPCIQINPLDDQGFIYGFPGIPPNENFERGAMILGEVEIFLPLLGVPASKVELRFRKTETITLQGSKCKPLVDELWHRVVWEWDRRRESTDVYKRKIAFRVPIPEELPATISLGNQGIEIQYSLHATVHRLNKLSLVWNSKPLSCTLPITIVKYDTHPAWPIYYHPERKWTVDDGSLRLLSNLERTCFGPGETVALTTALIFDSYADVPNSVEFQAKLQEVVTLTSLTGSPQPRGFFNKKSNKRTVSQYTTTRTRLGNDTTFTTDLAVQVPRNGMKLTFNASLVQVAYVLEVATNVHPQHLRVDVPIIISHWARHSLEEEIQKIGPVSRLGGTLHFVTAFPSSSSAKTLVPVSTDDDNKYKAIQDVGQGSTARRNERVTSMDSTVCGDDLGHIIPAIDITPAIDIGPFNIIVTDTDASEDRPSVPQRPMSLPVTSSLSLNPVTRRATSGSQQSRARMPPITDQAIHDHPSPPDIRHSRFQPKRRSSILDDRTTALLRDLEEIIPSQDKIKALTKLRDDRAQAVIDFLDLVLPELDPTMTWLRRRALVVLYRLCKASQLYPDCHSLHNITITSQEGGGGFCDIFKGQHENQVLCLKVVRQFTRTNTDQMLNVFAKEAILWSQLCHPNILPFYGIYYLDKERRRMCLVSPWMENGNLVGYLEENPLVPRKPFICDVVKGLEYLHRENIVHGDLKGANILVDASGTACITDFGFSTVFEEKSHIQADVTSTVYGGTYRWVAPELLDDSDNSVDESRPTFESDVWAFGCVCYQIMTRRLPYHESNSNYPVINKILRGELPTRPDPGTESASLDTIDDETWELLNICWAFNPSDRYTCQQIMGYLRLVGPLRFPVSEESNSVAEFKSAMRTKGGNSINLTKVGMIFDEIKRTEQRLRRAPSL